MFKSFLFVMGLGLMINVWGQTPTEQQANQNHDLDTITRVLPTGTTQMIYSVRKGTQIREGFFHSFHPNGTIAVKGAYQNNKMTGIWHFWYENQKPWKTCEYVDDMEHGHCQTWNEQGVLLSDNHYQHGNFEGEQKTFTPQGSPESVEQWKDGKRDGVLKLWDQGVLVREFHYRAGRLDGAGLIYYPNGSIKAEMGFHNSLPDGVMRQYDQQGGLLQETHYLRGFKQGRHRRWANAKLIEDHVYEQDRCVQGCSTPVSKQIAQKNQPAVPPKAPSAPAKPRKGRFPLYKTTISESWSW